MKALLIIFVRKKYYNFKSTNAGKCVTNRGEYSAVLRARRKKCHFVNKLCEGKCTRILKSYTLAERTTPAWNNTRHRNIHKYKYLLSISYVLLRICCYFKFFKDKFFCRSLCAVTVEYNFKYYIRDIIRLYCYYFQIENAYNFVTFDVKSIKGNCFLNSSHARNRMPKTVSKIN